MITLEEIENISFRKTGLSGYKIDDVDSFLDKVVKKVRSLELVNRELEGRIEAQNKEIQKYKEKEESVQSAIITAEMTAKQIVMEATRKSDEQLSESKEKAESIVREAQERADNINAETNARVEELMNRALRESADKIEENNRILEAQKKSIIRLMGEASKFRNSLLQAYKEHLKIINALAKPEDFKKQQKELEENYPPVHGQQPIALETATSAAEPAESTVEAKAEETVIAEVKTEEPAAPAAEVVTTADTDEKAEETAAESKENAESGITGSSRTPVVLSGSQPEAKLGVLKLDGADKPHSGKSGKSHKKRR
ncbi:MAG: DivIVA domain-containing protein [Clostridia bacterium]|nr:DivIVA domain-containing protein [Clostridia bacterium]